MTESAPGKNNVSRRDFLKVAATTAAALGADVLRRTTGIDANTFAAEAAGLEPQVTLPPNTEIDTVVTYGVRTENNETKLEPLDYIQCRQVIDYFNGLKAELDPRKRITMDIVSETTYKNFTLGPDDPRTIQAYYGDVHEAKNSIYDEGKKLLENVTLDEQFEGVEFRNVLIVVRDDIFPEPPESHHLGFIDPNNPGPYLYVDGWRGRVGELSEPRSSDYWIDALQADGSRLHEGCHLTEDLPDDYLIDYDYNLTGTQNLLRFIQDKKYPNGDKRIAEIVGVNVEEIEVHLIQKIELQKNQAEKNTSANVDPFRGVPTEWRKYFVNQRIGPPGTTPDPDGSTIMSEASQMKISRYAMYVQLNRIREGKMHDLTYTKPEIYGIPPLIAEENYLNVGTALNGQQFEIYRSEGDYGDRHFERILNGSVEDGKINIQNPWSDPNLLVNVQGRDMIPEYRSLLFIKVIGSDPDNPKWIYMDARSFFEAYIKHHKTKAVEFTHIPLADKNSIFQTHDWASHGNTRVYQEATLTSTPLPATETPQFTVTQTPPASTGTQTATVTEQPTVQPPISATPTPLRQRLEKIFIPLLKKGR